MAAPTSTTDELLELFRVVLQAARDTDRLLNLWLERELRLTMQDLSVLQSIAVGVEYPTDIAARLNQASPTVSHVISRLVGRGLIERERGSDDGRKRRLLLTAKGRDTLQKAHETSRSRWRTATSVSPTRTWLAPNARSRST